MRSFLAVLLSVVFLSGSLHAQRGLWPPGPRPPGVLGPPVRLVAPPIVVPAGPDLRPGIRRGAFGPGRVMPTRGASAAMPIALYECELDQCERPGSGGAVWLFQGREGRGVWAYQALARLTVVGFDGSTLRIHRVDPVGTYSSAYAAGRGAFTADYIGTVLGDRVEGVVYFNGDRRGPGAPWRATIVDGGFCTTAAGPCPLRPAELSLLGRLTLEGRMPQHAFQCFRLAAQGGDADAQGFAATMMMNGFGGPPDPALVRRWLEESARRGSYPGQKGLARAYAEGIYVERDPQRAAYWGQQAAAREAPRATAAESGRSWAVAGLGVVAVLAAVALLSGAGGSSPGSSAGSSAQPSEDERRAALESQRRKQEADRNYHRAEAEREAAEKAAEERALIIQEAKMREPSPYATPVP